MIFPNLHFVFGFAAILFCLEEAHSFSISPLQTLFHAPIPLSMSANEDLLSKQPRPVRSATQGFYPVWESTGYVERHGDFFLGSSSMHAGVTGFAQLGVLPMPFFFRTPNFFAKFKVFESSRLAVSAQAGYMSVQEGASRAFFSPMYSARLDNPDFTLSVLPATLSATHRVLSFIDLHHSATVLATWSDGPIVRNFYPGYFLTTEILPDYRHSALLHLGQVGFWNHDFALFGASYRYHGQVTEFRLGYFYRVRSIGTQGGPLVSFGFYL